MVHWLRGFNLELFIVIALSANVLLTAVCAYCISLAVYRNTDDPENEFLHKVTSVTRKLVIIGGSLLIAFSLWSALILIGGVYL